MVLNVRFSRRLDMTFKRRRDKDVKKTSIIKLETYLEDVLKRRLEKRAFKILSRRLLDLFEALSQRL